MDAMWVLAKALNSCVMLGNITNMGSTKSCDLIQEVASTKWKDKKVCAGLVVMQEAVRLIVRTTYVIIVMIFRVVNISSLIRVET